MANALIPAPFQDIGKSHQIALNVSHGVDKAVSHTGLGGQVHNDVKAFCFKQGIHLCGILQIHPHKPVSGLGNTRYHPVPGDVLFPDAVERKAVVFDLWIIIVVDGIQSDDLVSLLKELVCEMKSDESCGPGNEEFQSP